MNMSDENEDFEIFECLRDKIIPLLEEYFYGETEKVRKVLNEYTLNSSDTNFYIEDTDAFNSLADDEGVPQLYKLNEKLAEVKSEKEAKNFIDHIEQK